MSNHTIDDLIRIIDRDTFSEAAHGAGMRLVVAERKTTLYKPRLFGKLLGGRGERHVFVKRWSVPKEVKDWTFHWSEGTTAISLDFDANFVLQANEDVQALGLTQALLGEAEAAAGETLYGLINAHLHEEVNAMLRKCQGATQSLSLLDAFRRSSIGIGESDELDRSVTERVSKALGGAHFRIGFQLKNLPPMQIELKCSESFRLADSKLERKAETSALLQLDNYQAYQKSRLTTEAAVRATMEKTVARVVKQFLFSRNYYDIVRSFTQGGNSLVGQMKESIQAEALTIGYRVEMFQTFPDIAALKLLEPTRIDIPAGDEKYALFKSTGFVQIAVALSVKVAGDFSKLHLLIDPDAGDVVQPIAARVRQICRDCIQRFDHRDFNLNFDQAIVPELHRAIVQDLAIYGLETEVVHIRDLPTEDASRFLALRGRTIDFRAVIAPRADGADGDPVPVVGAIEVTGMAENGWAQFEGKDFGFRRDSPRTEQLLRILAMEQQIRLSDTMDRGALAIELELADIRARVVGTLEGAMAMGPQLAQHWSDWKSNQEISAWAEEMAARAIAEEYGLTIALRAFRRLDTDAETTLRVQRQAKHEQLRMVAAEESQAEISHQHALREASDANQLTLLNSLGTLEKLALGDESDPSHHEVLEKARHEAQRLETARRNTGASAGALLPSPKQSPDSPSQLPWSPARKDSGASRSDAGPGQAD
ncbi:MAG: hypothetical protein V4641_16635 [Pseudomonadota bacterium]